tara:strand:- start:2696 stop:3217 length:522 start_codon:yes stop_codon:yes gene_type:complete
LWNKTHNLVSKTQEKNIGEHIEECLLIAPGLSENVIDLGSGGGLPGIPLAITNPNKNFFLIESNTKKSAFLLNTTSKLHLTNTKVLNQRIEDIDISLLPGGLDVVCRAVGSTQIVVGLVSHILKEPGSRLKLMKTEEQFKEETLPPGFRVKKIDKFPLKAKDKTRILVTIESD